MHSILQYHFPHSIPCREVMGSLSLWDMNTTKLLIHSFTGLSISPVPYWHLCHIQGFLFGFCPCHHKASKLSGGAWCHHSILLQQEVPGPRNYGLEHNVSHTQSWRPRRWERVAAQESRGYWLAEAKNCHNSTQVHWRRSSLNYVYIAPCIFKTNLLYQNGGSEIHNFALLLIDFGFGMEQKPASLLCWIP